MDTPSKSARRGGLRYGLMDLFVVAACAITFAAVVGPGMHPASKGPPIALIARDLGTTPGQFQQVADQLEAYFDAVGGDGFMLSPIYSPGAIEEFVDLVVPELQRRGRFRTSYTGRTLRENLAI